MNTLIKKRGKSYYKSMEIDFKKQIEEDIQHIQSEWVYLDRNINKDHYSFNYWVLSRIYEVDETQIPKNITEYNDKGVDCFVHYEDNKELHFIQNKYYNDNTPVSRKDMTDFLSSPLVALNSNTYTRSNELKRIYNSIKDDPDYNIYFHFYVSNNRRGNDISEAIKNFNYNPPIKIAAKLSAKVFFLDDIYTIYNGQSLKKPNTFKFTISTTTRGTLLRILPEEYGLKSMRKAYFMLTPVFQLYQMYKEAKEKGYDLFEENIREYLGKSTINKSIIETLKSKEDRSNFFYYNNGITVLCEDVANEGSKKTSLVITKPQIINGCQTASSIYEVLSNCQSDEEAKKEYSEVFVMIRLMLFDKNPSSFFGDIVKYNNKQNAINENSFGSKKEVFGAIQREFEERGFLLLVKPSDKNKFSKEKFSAESDINKLLDKARNFSTHNEFNKLSDLFIPLDRLLQVFLAFMEDGYNAYTKKNAILNQKSLIYQTISININKTLTIENILRLYLLYVKAENKRKISQDKYSPIPFYLIGFIGSFISNKTKANNALDYLFKKTTLESFELIFKYFETITTLYKDEYLDQNNLGGYNEMIKKQIDNVILKKQVKTVDSILMDNNIAHFLSLVK